MVEEQRWPACGGALLAAMTVERIAASLVIDGTTDRTLFDTYVDGIPASTLRPSQVMVWDNLSAHKSARACERIEAAGYQVLFLPPYSPDYNPIEAFSELKTRLRRANQRTGGWSLGGDWERP